MRLGLPGIVLAVICSATGVHAEDGANWILVRAEAGPSGVDSYDLGIFSQLSRVDKAVGISGAAFATPSRSETTVSRIKGGSRRVSTSKQLGGVDFEIEEIAGTAGYGKSVSVAGGRLYPGESVYLLSFAVAFRIDSFGILNFTNAPFSEIEVRTGSDARALTLGEPENDGAAVSLGTAHVGATVVSSEVRGGIVGSFEHWSCGTCVRRWSSPDGRAGTSDSETLMLPGGEFNTGSNGAFAGPAGSWEWLWIGVGSSVEPLAGEPPVMGGYAPIGDAWQAFSPEQVSS